MKETEIKLQYAPEYREMLLRRCRELGFQPEDSVREEDVYYAAPHADLVARDEALRLRLVQSRARGAGSRITFKGPNQASGLHAREELETGVEDGAVLRNILERLDFSPLAAVVKERAYYRRGEVRLCIDQVEGLGSFFEVEILDGAAAEEQVLALAQALEIPGARVEPRTYLELILEKGEGTHG